MTNVEALKNLVNALSGTPNGNTNAELIDKIASLIKDGALVELPETTVSDNGMVLEVEQGKWTKKRPDKFPFIIPINFDPSSPLSGTVAFDSDKSADAMTALRAGRPICVQQVGAETNLSPISGMTCLSTADYSDTNPDHWDIIAYARANLFEISGGAVTSLSVIEINLQTNTWTASIKLFN